MSTAHATFSHEHHLIFIYLSSQSDMYLPTEQSNTCSVVSGRHKKQWNNKSDMHHVEMYSLLQIVVKHHCRLSRVRKNGQWCWTQRQGLGLTAHHWELEAFKKAWRWKIRKRKKSILVICYRLKETGNFLSGRPTQLILCLDSILVMWLKVIPM
jgi:hypothetical protein